MKLNKKVIESMTVVSAMVVMSTFTALAGSTEEIEESEENVAVTQTDIAVLEKTGTAGIIAELQKMELEALRESGLTTASIERVGNNLVMEGITRETEDASVLTETAGISEVVQSALASTEKSGSEPALTETAGISEVMQTALEETEETTKTVEKEQVEDSPIQMAAEDGTEEVLDTAPKDQDAKAADSQDEVSESQDTEQTDEDPESQDAEQIDETAENTEWADQVMPNVEEDMNIRTSPDETAELAGKFYRGDVAEIVEVGDEWTEITSGNVTGFVKNEYLVFGDEAYDLANEVCSMYATVNADGLRLRSEPHEEAGIVTTASNGEKLKVDKEVEGAEGWVAVKTSDSTAYVSADYVDVSLNLGTALTTEEVQAKEEAEAEAKAAEKAKKSGQKPAMSANTDEVVLLGALIQCEAGNSSYEGMLAVGSVVMNRVRSGGYPGSISGVIYQAGQFPPALSGSVAAVAANGVNGACLRAAQEAIGGADNTNGALQFRSASSGCGGTVIGGNVFF